MANTYKDSNGRYVCQFTAPNGQRHTLRLGTRSAKIATFSKARIEDLVTCAKYTHVVDPDTARWAANLPDKIYKRLADAGLVQAREHTVTALGPFIDQYIAARGYKKPNTLHNLRQVRRVLVTFFGENRSLQSITPGDCDDWRNRVIADG